MTVAMRTISGPLEDEERQKALFEGTLLIFKNVEHLATLSSFVDSMICEALGTEDPARVQFGMER